MYQQGIYSDCSFGINGSGVNMLIDELADTMPYIEFEQLKFRIIDTIKASNHARRVPKQRRVSKKLVN